MNITNMFFQIMHVYLNNDYLKLMPIEQEIRELYKLSKKHDLAHLVCVALNLEEFKDKEWYKPFFMESAKAMYRYEWMKGEQDKIYALFEKHRIPYIPLKGAVIRELYREPWHRTSCDIDILIPEERIEEAVGALTEELSYTGGKRSRYEVSLTAPNGVHFELHFDVEEEYVESGEFWSDARPESAESFKHLLSSEMLIFAHIAHMAKHFVNGGCGLRPFLDLWLMREKLTYDRGKLENMLYSHGLSAFGNGVFGLTDVWFEGKTANEREKKMQEFLLPAGVYGNIDNKISVTRSAGGSKLSYAIMRIFPPRSSLKIAYPLLNEYPWMLPICWVRRWFRLIGAGKLKQLKTEYDINRRLNAEELNSTDELLKSLGLDV